MNIDENKEVCIVGMGFVGLTLAIVIAERGFKVIGIEIDDNTLNKLKKGNSHFHETGLKERLKKVMANKTLTFSKDIKKTGNSKIYIITVGTPLNKKDYQVLKWLKELQKK